MSQWYILEHVVVMLQSCNYIFLVISVCSPTFPSVTSLQPAPPRDAHFVSTKKNEPQLLEPIPYEFMA